MQTLVLLPGALGYANQYAPLIEQLRLKNINAIALDLPNHGKNTNQSMASSVDKMAEAILELLEEFKEPINIFGHSLGGYIGLYLCLNFPHRVNKLFTLGTKWKWNQDIAEKETSLLNPDIMETKIPNYVNHLKNVHQNWRATLSSVSELMLNLANNSYLEPENLANIKQSVRIALGDKDQMVTLEETIFTFKVLQNTQLQIYPNTPHPFEKMDIKKLATDIADFY